MLSRASLLRELPAISSWANCILSQVFCVILMWQEVLVVCSVLPNALRDLPESKDPSLGFFEGTAAHFIKQ